MFGEPSFTLLARDPMFSVLIDQWVARREADMRCGLTPAADLDQVVDAKIVSAAGADWRCRHRHEWRTKAVAKSPDVITVTEMSTVSTVDLTGVMLQGKDAWSAPIALPSVPVFAAVQEASKLTGAPIATLLTFAFIESSFNPEAKAPNGTAAGLFQFTHETWTEMVSRFGVKYNIQEAMVFDPVANATMAGERINEYMTVLQQHCMPMSVSNAYCLHFLGITGGAKLILAAWDRSPHYTPTVLASTLFPIAALANKQMFGGLTVSELYAKLCQKVKGLAEVYASRYPSTGLPVLA
jgi:hypothetical protein